MNSLGLEQGQSSRALGAVLLMANWTPLRMFDSAFSAKQGDLALSMALRDYPFLLCINEDPDCAGLSLPFHQSYQAPSGPGFLFSTCLVFS